jgi:hypothetical protein
MSEKTKGIELLTLPITNRIGGGGCLDWTDPWRRAETNGGLLWMR